MDREPHACVIGAPKSTIRDTVTVLHGLWNLLCLGPGTLHAVYWFAMDCPDAATLPSNDLALDDLPAIVGTETAWAMAAISADAGRGALSTQGESRDTEISSDPGTLGKLRSPPASPTSGCSTRSRSGTAGGLHSGTIEVLDQRLAPTDFEWDRGGSWGGANVAAWVLQGLPEPDCGRPHYASPCRR